MKRQGLKNKFKHHINSSGEKMKIRIVVERKKDGKKVIIPLSKYEIFNLSDMFFLTSFHDGFLRDMEKNRIDIDSIRNKIHHLEFDVIDDGICYEYKGKGMPLKKIKNKHFYLVRKPKWR